MTARLDTCALCPRLCRPACPVATVTGREAAVPSFLAGAAVRARRGEWAASVAAEALGLCVDCDACAAYCHVHQPLGDLLREARAEFAPAPPPAPVGAPDGDATMVAIETDRRAFAAALAARLGRSVAAWRTSDRLGVSRRGHPGFPAHAAAVAAAARGRDLVVADGGVAVVLAAAGVPFRWLDEVVELGALRASCVPRASLDGHGCCGGAGPLAEVHPADAARLAARFARAGDAPLRDARCAAHLHACGEAASDAVDLLIGGFDG